MKTISIYFTKKEISFSHNSRRKHYYNIRWIQQEYSAISNKNLLIGSWRLTHPCQSLRHWQNSRSRIRTHILKRSMPWSPLFLNGLMKVHYKLFKHWLLHLFLLWTFLVLTGHSNHGSSKLWEKWDLYICNMADM